MAGKKKHSSSKGAKKPRGHYCKVCGQYKANEKFSGRGHAAHICKECSKLSPAERAETETITRLWNLPGRRLSESQKKWLTNRVHDKRPEVADTAREVRNLIFPFAERNERKRQLHIDTLAFELHNEVYDEYGDCRTVNQKFTVDRRTNLLTMTDFDQGDGERRVILDGGKKRKLLNWIVHSLEIFMWPEDYQLRQDPYYNPYDPDIDLLPEYRDIDDFDEDEPDDEEELPPQEPEGEPYWRVHIEYCSGDDQDIACYLDYLPDRAEELYFALLEYFEPEEEEELDDEKIVSDL